MNNNKIELKDNSPKEFEKYLDERFEEFLQREGIEKDSLTEIALKVFSKGYKYVFVSTRPEEVEL